MVACRTWATQGGGGGGDSREKICNLTVNLTMTGKCGAALNKGSGRQDSQRRERTTEAGYTPAILVGRVQIAPLTHQLLQTLQVPSTPSLQRRNQSKSTTTERPPSVTTERPPSSVYQCWLKREPSDQLLRAGQQRTTLHDKRRLTPQPRESTASFTFPHNTRGWQPGKRPHT